MMKQANRQQISMGARWMDLGQGAAKAVGVVGVLLVVLMMGTQRAAAAFVYDVTQRVAYTDPLNTDGWLDEGTTDPADPLWVYSKRDGDPYMKNGTYSGGQAGPIYRPNDAGWAYSISDDATEVVFEVTAHLAGTANMANARLVQVGLRDGSGNVRFSIGVDMNNDKKWFVTDASGDATKSTVLIPGAGGETTEAQYTLRLVIDTAANGGEGSGELFVDGDSVISGVNMGLSAYSLSDLDSLFVWANTHYVGPSMIAIDSVIPEPASLGLFGAGLLLMVRRCSR